jgi:hypothetical protein
MADIENSLKSGRKYRVVHDARGDRPQATASGISVEIIAGANIRRKSNRFSLRNKR